MNMITDPAVIAQTLALIKQAQSKPDELRRGRSYAWR